MPRSSVAGRAGARGLKRCKSSFRMRIREYVLRNSPSTTTAILRTALLEIPRGQVNLTRKMHYDDMEEERGVS